MTNMNIFFSFIFILEVIKDVILDDGNKIRRNLVGEESNCVYQLVTKSLNSFFSITTPLQIHIHIQIQIQIQMHIQIQMYT